MASSSQQPCSWESALLLGWVAAPAARAAPAELALGCELAYRADRNAGQRFKIQMLLLVPVTAEL